MDILICADEVCVHYSEEEKCRIQEEVDRLNQGAVRCPCYNPHPASYAHDIDQYKGKIIAACREKFYSND